MLYMDGWVFYRNVSLSGKNRRERGKERRTRTARKSFVVPSHHHSTNVVRDKNTEIAGEKKGEKLALCGRI